MSENKKNTQSREKNNSLIVLSVMAVFVIAVLLCAIIPKMIRDNKNNEETSPSVTTTPPSSTLFPTKYEFETEEFGYDILDDGSVAIKDYISNGEAVVVPAEIDGKAVTMLCENMLADSYNVKKITIPESIKVIECAVFAGPKDLEEIRYEGSRTSFLEINISSIGNSYLGDGMFQHADVVYGKRENE